MRKYSELEGARRDYSEEKRIGLVVAVVCLIALIVAAICFTVMSQS